MSGGAEFFNEMREPDGSVRSAYSDYCKWYDGQDPKLLRRKHSEAETNFRKTGITFNVYGEDEAEDDADLADRAQRAREEARGDERDEGNRLRPDQVGREDERQQGDDGDQEGGPAQ